MTLLVENGFTMKKIHWRLLHCPQRVKCWLGEKIEYCHLAMFTLCYNQFTSFNTMLDAALEPLFWIVDHFTKYMGPVSNETASFTAASWIIERPESCSDSCTT